MSGFFESLVDMQVGLFMLFQFARVVGAVVTALMVTGVKPGLPGSLVGGQVG